MKTHSLRIGFVSTRLSGTDGVSLEAKKWRDVLTEMGHSCYFFAGESDEPPERTRVVPEAHFQHPLILKITADLFDDSLRHGETSEAVHDLRKLLKARLHEFVKDFEIQMLVIENALAIPMNVPLGLALTELIAETTMPVIAHHHDFAWERTRFAVDAAEDYLQAAFPPAMESVHHVVINSYASRELARRTGMPSTLIPNVMDFDKGPPPADDYADSLRQSLGVADDEWLLLQPTRIVPRKRIERSIELVRRLGRPATLVISHHAGDEGADYEAYLKEFAGMLDVRVLFAAEHFAYDRAHTDGRKIYSLADAYRQADLITYPSTVEGFGNAFLETIFYRRPLMMSNYDIFKTDIRPKGFEVIGFDEYITSGTVDCARQVLSNRREVERMVEKNYDLGRKNYSFSVLRRRLTTLIQDSLEQVH